jgi:hypothetical protein
MVCIATRKIGLYVIATSLIVAGMSVQQKACAQDAKKSAGKSAAKAAEPRHRLPPYYAKVVDDAQKEKIYAIQDKHAARIDALEAELKAAREKRDTEIEGVLTSKQKADIKALAAAAKAKRGTNGKAAVDETDAKPAAKATIRAPGKTATKKAG